MLVLTLLTNVVDADHHCVTASREAIGDDVERVLDVERTRRRELRDLIKSSLLEDLADAQEHILKRQSLGLVLRVQHLEESAGQRPTGSAYKWQRVGFVKKVARKQTASRCAAGRGMGQCDERTNVPAGSGREKLATLDTSAEVCSSRHPEIILTSAGMSFSACSRADDIVRSKGKSNGGVLFVSQRRCEIMNVASRC